jgi:hypothetical protein
MPSKQGRARGLLAPFARRQRASATRLLETLALLGFAACLVATPSFPNQDRAEVNEALRRNLRDKPSMDDHPINFSVQSVRYQVPRNYIVRMDTWTGGPQTLVVFRVTYPDLAPLTHASQRCFFAPPNFDGNGCAPQEFFVTVGSAVSDEEGFANFRSTFLSQTPENGPFGFERYNTGPPDARIATYRKRVAEHWLIFSCRHGSSFESTTAERHERAVCTRTSRLPNGNELGYHFYEGELSIVERMDERLREMIHGFEVKGS